jgi:hypothetical protein
LVTLTHSYCLEPMLRLNLKSEAKLAMFSFLTQIQALNSSTPQPAQPRFESRRSRRQKARDAAKSARKAA